jgi:hypothetical protein
MLKIAKDGRVFTRKRWHECIVRVPRDILCLWVSAASKREVSRAEFLRQALRAEASRVLGEKTAD